MAWLPIETAPRDGTAVLLDVEYDKNDVQLYVPWPDIPAVIGWWGDGAWKACFVSTGGCPSGGYDTEFDNVEPTLWMPIPKPPAD